MYISAKGVDTDIKPVTYDKDDDEDDQADEAVAHHRAYLVEHLRDYAGSKTQSQQTAV